MSETQEPELEPILRADPSAAPGWLAPVRRALAASGELDVAVRRLAALLETRVADGPRLLEARVADGPRLFEATRAEAEPARAATLARILVALVDVAPFLTAHLRRHPDWLLALLDDDLAQPLDAARSRRALAEALAVSGDAEATLRLHKYRELARITIRDADPSLVPLAASEVTLRDLSALADLLLAEAFTVASARILASLGPPIWWTEDGVRTPCSCVVLGLGKLGSQELNYSSDVDLVYVHASPPGPLAAAPPRGEAGAAVAPADYFTRLSQTFGRLVTALTADGFLYRVDLELRPEGAQGQVVPSQDALETYYEAWADTWERAAFMKARPVAGDLELGWRVLRALAPMLHQSTRDYGAVESIRSLQQKVEAAHGESAAGWNVKIDAGGIRDIEFIAQALQLLHGGRIPQVRERSTARALASLADVGVLPRADAEQLGEAYRFLRRVENRIQMENEKQAHLVPDDARARTRLARAMGPETVGDASAADDHVLAAFDAAVARTRASVRTRVEASFGRGGGERVRELFARHAHRLASQPGMGRLLDDLAARFDRCLDAVPESERALNNLDRFLEGVGSRRFYYELLLDRPELVERLTALFASSRFLSALLARYPRLIEPVFADPNVLLLSRAELEADLRATRAAQGESGAATPGPSTEAALDALRSFQHRQIVNVGLLDLAGKVTRAEVEGALTEIAEVCVGDALALAEAQLARGGETVAGGEFLVVGMGKLGTRELGYGSDLDLIFLYDAPAAEAPEHAQAQHHFVRVTQRLISALQTATSEGSCYEIDARLRPSGNQGTLVTSLSSFAEYHATSAAVWEQQALLRARPVAGARALGERFEALRLSRLRQPLPRDAIAEADAIRRRMENELARETGRRRNFKTGRGGLLDVETVVQLLQLRAGAEHPELFEPVRLETQLDRLERLGLLAAADAATLRAGFEFLQQLASRLRIVENRSISDLDAERGDLESLARRLGYAAGDRDGGARRALLRDYAHHTEAIREVYERFVRTG